MMEHCLFPDAIEFINFEKKKRNLSTRWLFLQVHILCMNVNESSLFPHTYLPDNKDITHTHILSPPFHIPSLSSRRPTSELAPSTP